MLLDKNARGKSLLVIFRQDWNYLLQHDDAVIQLFVTEVHGSLIDRNA